MGLKTVRVLAFLLFPISLTTVLEAAPQLRLASATVGPLSVAVGSGATQTVEAYNIGSGSLNLTVSSSVPWIAPSVGAARACTTTRNSQSCLPLTLALNTQSLPAGTATGIVTVSDPNAVDAPQTITVTVAMGGTIPSSQTFYVPPNGTASLPIPTTSQIHTSSNAPWLRVTVNGGGSFVFPIPYAIQVTDTPTYPVGVYNGSLSVSGSTFAPDNKTVAVTMNVTPQPIAQAIPSVLNLRLAAGAPKLVAPFAPGVGLTNLGQGTLSPQTPSVTTSSCGSSWISYGAAGLTVDPGNLTPGTCNATISLASNAINGTQTVPVTLTVVPKGAAVINYQGVLDNATYVPGDSVAPGDVMIVQGDQLSFSGFTPGPAPPLATQLADTSVLVNGAAAPLFYTSYGQIAFQMPMNVSGTALVQVKRTDATVSNTVSVNVLPRAPKVLQLYGGPWGAVVNNDGCAGAASCLLGGSLPFPTSFSQPGYPAYPAKPGDVLTIYAIGLGPTSPSVATGQAAPAAEPFARLTATPTVDFGTGLFPVSATPSFAALAPGFAGLYQINVTVPANAPKGIVNMLVGFPDTTVSNVFTIAIQ